MTARATERPCARVECPHNAHGRCMAGMLTAQRCRDRVTPQGDAEK